MGCIARSRESTKCHPGLMIELHDRGSPDADNPVVVHLQQLGYEVEWLGDVCITAHIIARWPRKACGNETS